MTYLPPGLCSDLRSFFARNPDEVLSLEDIAVKFNAREETVRKAVAVLKKHGVVRTEVVVSAA